MVSGRWFQSTHPWRVWLNFVWQLSSISLSFNPHTHEGCDMVVNAVFRRSTCFNPHTHEGCDLTKEHIVRGRLVSIHTPTKGVTSFSFAHYLSPSCFNPHTHEGCDFNFLFVQNLTKVSIHTPTKGVTFMHRVCGRGSGVSIHTPTKGVTQQRWANNASKWFQSTHPRRVWHYYQ